MFVNEALSLSEKDARAFSQFLVAQHMVKTVTNLEHQTAELRKAIIDLRLEALQAPEGRAFSISVVNHEGALHIESFNPRKGEFEGPYRTTDPEYDALVKRSRWGDDANIDVDRLEFSGIDIWGVDTKRRIRVKVDAHVQLHEVPASEDS